MLAVRKRERQPADDARILRLAALPSLPREPEHADDRNLAIEVRRELARGILAVAQAEDGSPSCENGCRSS